MNAEFESAERRLNELLRLQAGGSRQIRIRPGGFVNAAPPARPHDEEERLVAEHFFKAMTGADVFVESGDNPPDCIVQLGTTRRTVELGALFDRTAAEAMRQEEAFTLAINKHANLLPEHTRIGLVMWDDSTQTRTPTDDAAAYPTIVRWLTGCFIDRSSPTGQFMIHQYVADRPARMNFPKGGEVERLARELASLVASLPRDQSHVSTCTHVNLQPPRCEKPRLGAVDKLRDTDQHADYLLVHNYFPLSDIAMELWHAYWHERGAILELVRTLARTGNHKFEEVLFADYSHRIGGCVAHRVWSTNPTCRIDLLGEFDYLDGTFRAPRNTASEPQNS